VVDGETGIDYNIPIGGIRGYVMSVPVAFAAGIAAFFSPCVLPLLPAWLAFLGGNKSESKLTLAINLLFFAMGFSLVFTALGASATALGQILFRYQAVLTRIAGVVLIIFALQMLGLLRLSFLHRNISFAHSPKRNRWGYFLFGIILALGWTPCVGYLLATILMLAGSLETVGQGMFLLFVFSLGFALPFFITGLLIGPAPLAKISRRLSRYVQGVASLVLLVMGVLLLLNKWVWFQSLFL
jgi:cytochrome c-type biogenesis protein